VYRHVRPRSIAPPRCPACGTARVRFHSWRRRSVEPPDVDRPRYLVLQLAKSACDAPVCARKDFTPPIPEAAPHARTSRRLQQTAAGLYRRGKAALRDVAGDLRAFWHTGTGKSSVLRWHRQTQAAAYPHPAALPFSGVLCIDAVYDRVGGQRSPSFTAVDPIAGLTVRIPIERADAPHLTAALQRVRALGAAPRVIVSDLWAAYPDALRPVWPRAERQLCWFHGMQWTTRKLGERLKRHGEALPAAERKELNRRRFRLLAGPEKQAKLSARQRAALARAWELIAGTVVEEALQPRNDLRAVLNTSASRAEARAQFDALRETWPARFRPWTWRPGQPLPEPVADDRAEGATGLRATGLRATGLRAYLEQIMAFFVRHFERMILYLDRPGVPRTNNPAERSNRRYRAIARPRYGWGSAAGRQAILTALQGFDSS
jgi:transposase